MKNLVFYVFVLTTLLVGCNKKKLIEVEVPLPEEASTTVVKVNNPDDVKLDENSIFELYKLPYKYDALEPNIDTKTMEVHYSKHYLGYTNNLNKAIIGTEFEKLTIEEILNKLTPDNSVLRNNAGGYYNHNLFWEIMAPNKGGEPTGTLNKAIIADFGSYQAFLESFNEAASKQFGSGWAWLIIDKTGKLQVTSTPNQDNPLMQNATLKGKPILCIDVWEHAYYLKYQNKRKDYISNFVNVINWDMVSKKYEAAISEK